MEYCFCPMCGGTLEPRRPNPRDRERPICSRCGFIVYIDPKVAVGTIIRWSANGTERAGTARASGVSVSEQPEGTAAERRLRAPRIVLVRRAIEPGYGLWVFPGGYVDRGEPLVDAAVREAREEAGIDVRVDSLLNVYSYAGATPIIVVYAATHLGGELCTDDECLEAATFSEADIPWEKLAFRSTGEALREYFARKRGV